MTLKAICNHKRQFMDIDIRNPGSASDYLCFTTLEIIWNLETPGFLADGLCLFGDNVYINTPFMASPLKASVSFPPIELCSGIRFFFKSFLGEPIDGEKCSSKHVSDCLFCWNYLSVHDPLFKLMRGDETPSLSKTGEEEEMEGESVDQPVHWCLDTLHRHRTRYTEIPYGGKLPKDIDRISSLFY